MAEETREPSFVPAIQAPKRGGSSWMTIVVLVVVFLVAFVAYLLFSKPETVPSAVLFEKLFPRGTAIRELEEINLDIESVLQHPVFKTLKEQGPLPLEVPPAGKPNPFI